MAVPTDAQARKRKEKEVKQSAAKDLEMSMQEACLDEATSGTEFTQCMATFSTSKDDTMKVIFGNLPDAALVKRKQTASREASRELIGGLYLACMELAENGTAREACKTE